MTLNETLCIEMPPDFPANEYEQFLHSSRTIMLPEKGPAWAEFAGASNLIGWRYRNAFEALNAYLQSWAEHGESCGFEEIYSRDHYLFTTTTASCSCIESTCYAIYALCSHPKTLSVPFGRTQQRLSSPSTLRTAVASHPQAALLSGALDSLIASSDWSVWTSLRNRLVHRSNLPRIIRAGAAPAAAKEFEYAPTSTTPRMTGTGVDLTAMFDSITEAVRELLIGAKQIADAA